ncbi:Sir2 family NAD-dependent protein deacetylase [Lactobacillus intestinalis]|uniref:Sir2 family NAD-dependent protein deacetylase n=1 Tax=Lactobacillus intestinalis TaxID=151781 RepID=UPI0024310697|nr:Sir2 family NAD-dependent protein deacetylase [Lactobacillus intestinalis]
MTEVEQAKKWLSDANAIIVTAGNGFAQEEGLDILSEENFDNDFGEIAEKYDVHTIGDALDKKFDSWGEQWAFWSELINQYTLNYVPSENMGNLKKLLDDKQYFIATSTFAHYFENSGFNPNRIFNVFGDWTTMQCSSGVNHGQKSNIEVVKSFIKAKGTGLDLESLVPKCEICNSEMEIHMPLNAHFFPDTDANARLRWFLTANEDKKVVVLELGVDETSPQLLDPMISLVDQFPNWHYITADLKKEDLPENIQKKSAVLNSDVHNLLKQLTE